MHSSSDHPRAGQFHWSAPDLLSFLRIWVKSLQHDLMRIVVGASPSVTNTKGVGINTLGERFDVAQVGTWTEQPRAWRRGAAVKESSSSSSSSSSESSDGEGLEEQVGGERRREELWREKNSFRSVSPETVQKGVPEAKVYVALWDFSRHEAGTTMDILVSRLRVALQWGTVNRIRGSFEVKLNS